MLNGARPRPFGLQFGKKTKSSYGLFDKINIYGIIQTMLVKAADSMDRRRVPVWQFTLQLNHPCGSAGYADAAWIAQGF